MAEKQEPRTQVTVGGMSVGERERLLKRVEGLTEFPLMVLSIVMVPLLMGPFLWDLTRQEEAVFLAMDYFIWAVFAVDLVVKAAIAPDRKRFFRTHWIDVVIVAVPFFRPLRLLRLLVFSSRAVTGYRRLANVDFLLLYAVIIIVTAAMVVTTVEVDYPGSNIKDFDDALWWAITTVTTVGYGDRFPVTGAGRAMGSFLMIGGIALFGGLTANIASFFVRHSYKEDEKEAAQPDAATLLAEIKSLREEVTKLRRGRA
ncbi:MAG: potassium channel family protein [Chloroflexi bacterium]|nr:potassium channel family protein [Chloroflexota bacterium]